MLGMNRHRRLRQLRRYWIRRSLGLRTARDRMNPFLFYDNEEFIRRFRFSKTFVLRLCDELSNELQKDSRGLSLSVELQIVLTLRFYATGSFEKVIGDLFGISESVTCVTIHRVTKAIACLKSRILRMPHSHEIDLIRRQFYDLSSFPQVIGAIDGSHVRILCPSKDIAQIFYNRKGYYSINVQAVCDAQLLFRNIVARWPGSTHDARIFSNSSLRSDFESNVYAPNVLLGDSGYRCTSYLLTPILNPSTPAEHRYNTAHIKGRCVIERCFGIWKKRFPCLQLGLRTNINNSLAIIVATAVLHNMAMQRSERIDLFSDIRDDSDEFVGEVMSYDAGGFARRRSLLSTHFSN